MIKEIKNHKLFGEHDFDAVFSELYNLYKNNFLTLFISSFIGIIILQTVFFQLGLNNFETLAGAPYSRQITSNLFLLITLFLAGSIIIYSLLHVFITYYILAKQENQDTKPFPALGHSAGKYLLRYLVLTIVVFIMIAISGAIGVIVLIIGSLLAALYMGTSLFISGTTLIVEDINPFDAISRSFILSHKDFWTTLGMVVVFILIVVLINFILSAIISIPGAIVFLTEMFSEGNISEMFSPGNIETFLQFGMITIILSSIANALILPLAPLFSILLYYRLRYIEENQKPADG